MKSTFKGLSKKDREEIMHEAKEMCKKPRPRPALQVPREDNGEWAQDCCAEEMRKKMKAKMRRITLEDFLDYPSLAKGVFYIP